MKAPAFSISDVIQRGWELTKANIGYLLVYQIILWAFVILLIATQERAILHVLIWIVVVLLKMGLYKAALLITDGIKPGYEELYQNWRQLPSWIIAGILFGFMFAFGLILLVVPGLYVWARYDLYPFAILDKQLGPINALKDASKISEGNRWQIFLLFLACVGLNILGMLVLGIGILISAPVTLIAVAIAYRQLQAQTNTAIVQEVR
jgi:uncharacterized membrane protein